MKKGTEGTESREMDGGIYNREIRSNTISSGKRLVRVITRSGSLFRCPDERGSPHLSIHSSIHLFFH